MELLGQDFQWPLCSGRMEATFLLASVRMLGASFLFLFAHNRLLRIESFHCKLPLVKLKVESYFSFVLHLFKITIIVLVAG